MGLAELQDEVGVKLRTLKRESIVQVCLYTKCLVDEDEARSKNSFMLLKLLDNKVITVSESEEMGVTCQFITNLLAFINHEVDEDSLECMAEQTKPLQPKPLSNVVKEKNLMPEVTIKKDYKIWGQIGDCAQKDKLTYTNLLHQINAGLRKGYLETDIVEAVIRAITPGLPLRSMLETKSNLTLAELKTVLKGHYKEENTSDLYQQLVNLSQDTRETAQSFLFRAIQLKDRLLLASEDEEVEQYKPDLIKRKFLRTVFTGLLSESLKTRYVRY